MGNCACCPFVAKLVIGGRALSPGFSSVSAGVVFLLAAWLRGEVWHVAVTTRSHVRRCLALRLLDLWVEELCEQLLAFINQHVGAGPALTSPILWWFTVVNLCLLVCDHAHARIIKLHPLALTFHDGVVVAELKALTLVNHHALQVVHFRTAFRILNSKLLRERNPKIKFLLHERLRVDPKALQMHEQYFRIVSDHDLFSSYLARHACFTHQLVILVKELLERKAAHTLDQ